MSEGDTIDMRVFGCTQVLLDIIARCSAEVRATFILTPEQLEFLKQNERTAKHSTGC